MAGDRLAILKNDFYIPQDLIWRRTAHMLERTPTAENLLITHPKVADAAVFGAQFVEVPLPRVLFLDPDCSGEFVAGG
mgnify:CR=1 FL=1